MPSLSKRKLCLGAAPPVRPIGRHRREKAKMKHVLILMTLLANTSCGSEKNGPWWPIEEGASWTFGGVASDGFPAQMTVEVSECPLLSDLCRVRFEVDAHATSSTLDWSLGPSNSSVALTGDETDPTSSFPTANVVDGKEVVWEIDGWAARGHWSVNGDCATLSGDDISLGVCRGDGLCYWKCGGQCAENNGLSLRPFGQYLQEIWSDSSGCRQVTEDASLISFPK